MQFHDSIPLATNDTKQIGGMSLFDNVLEKFHMISKRAWVFWRLRKIGKWLSYYAMHFRLPL